MDGLLLTKEPEASEELDGQLQDSLETSQIGLLVDEMGEDREAFELAKKIVREYEAKQKKLRDLLDNRYSPDQPGEVSGETHKCRFGAKGQERTIISIPLLVKLLGAEVFMQVATVPLKAIDKYLTGPQRDEVLSTDRTGTRDLKIGRAHV